MFFLFFSKPLSFFGFSPQRGQQHPSAVQAVDVVFVSARLG